MTPSQSHLLCLHVLLHCNMRCSDRIPPSGCFVQVLLTVWSCTCAWWQCRGQSFLALRKHSECAVSAVRLMGMCKFSLLCCTEPAAM